MLEELPLALPEPLPQLDQLHQSLLISSSVPLVPLLVWSEDDVVPSALWVTVPV